MRECNFELLDISEFLEQAAYKKASSVYDKTLNTYANEAIRVKSIEGHAQTCIREISNTF